jgi:hypothetical protein
VPAGHFAKNLASVGWWSRKVYQKSAYIPSPSLGHTTILCTPEDGNRIYFQNVVFVWTTRTMGRALENSLKHQCY